MIVLLFSVTAFALPSLHPSGNAKVDEAIGKFRDTLEKIYDMDQIPRVGLRQDPLNSILHSAVIYGMLDKLGPEVKFLSYLVHTETARRPRAGDQRVEPRV